MTVSSAMTGITAVVALKAASAGTAPPAGIRVFSAQHVYWNNSIATNSAVAVQHVSQGNLQILLSVLSSASGTVSGASSGSWTARIRQDYNPFVPSGLIRSAVYDAVNQPARNEIVSVGFSTQTDSLDNMAVLLDVVGATASPYENSAGATGNQTSTSSTTCPDGTGNVLTITPTNANGLVVADIGVYYNGVKGSSGVMQSLTTWQTPWTSADYNTNGDTPMENSDGFGMYYNPDTSAVTLTWTVSYAAGSTAVGYWAAAAAAYK
jgi:hypothetical protein